MPARDFDRACASSRSRRATPETTLASLRPPPRFAHLEARLTCPHRPAAKYPLRCSNIASKGEPNGLRQRLEFLLSRAHCARKRRDRGPGGTTLMLGAAQRNLSNATL